MRLRAAVKWCGFGLGGLLGIGILAIVACYALVEIELRRTFPLSEHGLEIPGDEASIAEGQRLARLRGCYGGCHGDGVNGRLNFALPDGTRLYAPDLARAARERTPAEFATIVRRGVRPDGTGVINMPSEMFQDLSDEDLGKILAYLLSQPAAPQKFPTRRIGPIARLVAVTLDAGVDGLLPAKRIDQQRAAVLRTPTDELELGRYLGHTVCSECHGVDLRGEEVFGGLFNPNLAIAAAYSPDAFRTLMRTGQSLSGRDLELMDDVAIRRFSSFTDREIRALHAYLKTLPASR